MKQRKTVSRAAESFLKRVKELEAYLERVKENLGEEHLSRSYDYAVKRLYCEVGRLILEAVIASLPENQNPRARIKLPPELLLRVCGGVAGGRGYIDFRSASDLTAALRQFLPPKHLLVVLIRRAKFQNAFDRIAVQWAMQKTRARQGAVTKVFLREMALEKKARAAGWGRMKSRYSLLVQNFSEFAQELINYSA